MGRTAFQGGLRSRSPRGMNVLSTPSQSKAPHFSHVLGDVNCDSWSASPECAMPDKLRTRTAGGRESTVQSEYFMAERLPDFKIVSDVGSGINWINWKRPGLLAVLDGALDGSLTESSPNFCLLHHALSTHEHGSSKTGRSSVADGVAVNDRVWCQQQQQGGRVVRQADDAAAAVAGPSSRAGGQP